MEQKNKIFLIILTALLLGGCGQTVDHKGKTPLVQVGNEFLYKEDLRAAMPVGIKGQDSISVCGALYPHMGGRCPFVS